MASIISFTNHKGGVAKTTSALNVAECLSRLGHRVLCIDMDPQGNLTQGLGVTHEPEYNTYSLLRGDCTLTDAIIHLEKFSEGELFLVPATLDLAMAETEFIGRIRREFVLSDLLSRQVESFHYIIIDCPPSLGLLTINALLASHHYIVPMRADFFSLQGLQKLIAAVDTFARSGKVRLSMLGVFFCVYSSRKVLQRDAFSLVQKRLEEKVFEATIRESIALSEAQSYGMPIYYYDKMREQTSAGTVDYMRLSEQILERIREEILA